MMGNNSFPLDNDLGRIDIIYFEGVNCNIVIKQPKCMGFIKDITCDAYFYCLFLYEKRFVDSLQKSYFLLTPITNVLSPLKR
jgi:hypothetical protein